LTNHLRDDDPLIGPYGRTTRREVVGDLCLRAGK
jgi:hypothetical protein